MDKDTFTTILVIFSAALSAMVVHYGLMENSPPSLHPIAAPPHPIVAPFPRQADLGYN
jgi:hypothetical protein